MSQKGGFNQAKHPLKGETIGLVEEGSVRKITSRTYGWGFPAHAFPEYMELNPNVIRGSGFGRPPR